MQRFRHLVRLGHARVEQAFTQAVTLQGVEYEGLFISKGRFSHLEIDLQALAEKVFDRVTQEVLKLRDAQGFFLLMVLQCRGLRRLGIWLVQGLPFPGEAEEAFAVDVALLGVRKKVTGAE